VFGVPFRGGRNFTANEAVEGQPVAIVSESLATRLWPQGNAVGASLRLVSDPRSHLAARSPLHYSAVQVFGVVRDVNTGLVEDANSRALMYFPTHAHATGSAILLRVNGDTEAARQKIDKELTESIPSGVDSIHKMQELVAGRLYPFRMAYWISAALGILALLLTISGIYGVLSYLIEQRVRELGLQMALGATRISVVGLVLRHSLRLALIGIGVGAALALGASKLLSAALVAIHASDAAAFGGGIAIVLLACIAASLIPSMRASRVDPLNTLRHD
jgi:ABC-type lipoprotein release transport system permease subunit